MSTYFSGIILSVSLFLVGGLIPSTKEDPKIRGLLRSISAEVVELPTTTTTTTTTMQTIEFSHGNIDWLPELATEAGWPQETHKKLGEIILRESGGCPNRRGGDIVDKNCNITGVAEKTHRSDTGLMQINGVNYDPTRSKWASICREMNICTQEPLLDPLTNLKAGLLLYNYSGWGPWDPCQWGPKYAHRCAKP